MFGAPQFGNHWSTPERTGSGSAYLDAVYIRCGWHRFSHQCISVSLYKNVMTKRTFCNEMSEYRFSGFGSKVKRYLKIDKHHNKTMS